MMYANTLSVSPGSFALNRSVQWHQAEHRVDSLSAYPSFGRQVVDLIKPSLPSFGFQRNYKHDVAVAPGRAATAEWLGRMVELVKLEDTIDSLAGQPISEDHQVAISEATRKMAKCFLRNLPDTIPLPRISPDGEMGLHLYWSGDKEKVVTVDDFYLHGVNGAGTATATYVDDLQYDGGELPRDVMALFE